MRTFLAFLKISWQQTLSYRAESFIWFVLEVIPLLPLISLWIYLEKIQQMSHQQSVSLILYYLVTIGISRLFSSHFEDWLIDDIKDGKISSSLLKPFSYKLFLLASETSWRVSGFIYYIPVLFFLGPIVIGSFNTTPFLVIASLFILVVSYVQRFYISLIIATTSFWMDQSKSLIHFKWMAEGVLGGSWLPLYFFPLWLQTFAKFTPFYSWYYFPTQLILNLLKPSEVWSGLLMSVVWVVGLVLFGNLFWKKAINKYSAVGS